MGEAVMQNVLDSGPGGSTNKQSFGGGDQAGDRYPERNLTKLQGPAAAKEIFRLWIAQNPIMRRHKAQWKVNGLRRSGVTGVVLIKRQDTQEWQAYAPPGTGRQVPALNKAARLCRLLRSTLFTDPPVPEATPATDADEDRDAAEFSTRVLIDVGNEGNLDNAATAEQAFDLSSIYGSGIRVYYVDPQGGGQRPYAVQAAAGATTFNPAQPQSALLDPTTGQVAPPPYVTKYVLADWILTDNANDPRVQRVWLPKLKCDVLTAKHVRPLPATSRDVWAAQGLLVGSWVPLDELRGRFPGKIPTDEEGLKKLTTKPAEDFLDLLPGGRANRAVLDQPKITGDSLVLVMRCWYVQSPAYPKGYYGVAAGQELLLHAGVWYNEQAKEPLDLPVDQFKQLDDEDAFPGMGMMQVLGPANEIRAGVLGSMLEHLDRFLNRKVFYPITSALQPRAMQAATGTYIPITPGGEPKVEQVPDFPQAATKMFEGISAEMDHESGLEPPSSGQNPSSVQSGLHARTIIEQVNVGLSDIRNNVVRALVRGWRIQLQQIRWQYTIPQRLGWVGDDGQYKEKEWRGADLGSTRDVMLHKGSLSMLAPSAKLAVAEQMSQMTVNNQPLIEAEDLRRLVIGNVGGLVGLQDDPHRMRIRRQIGQWGEGPPPGWKPAIDPVTGQPAVDPVTGQPRPDPVLGPMWAPVPADDDRSVAFVRAHELARLTASTRYARWPAPWRAPVDAEYLRMRHAAGLVTVAEEQAAQQQVAQQQQQQVDTVAQYTQQVQQLAQAVAAVQQQLQQVAKAVGPAMQAQIAPIAEGLAELVAEVQALGKAQQAGTGDLVKVAQNVDRELGKHKTQLDRVAQTAQAAATKPAAAPPPPPAPPGPRVMRVTERDAAGRIQTVVDEPVGAP